MSSSAVVSSTQPGTEQESDDSQSMFQVIDGEAKFASEDVPDRVPFNTWLSSHKQFMGRANDYHVVAILGAQSSGKSTLLNLLFSTNFKVMNAAIARTRTTHGVWVGIPEIMPPGREGSLMVLDLEGTDGGVRADDYSFERKTSLFSLAIASVLMVNVWYQDIGRYQASNFGLLRTVFELDLQLFQRETGTKTLVIFVIRDHVETPFESLVADIRSALMTTWEKISKPPQFTNSPPEQFFDFEFIAFPHMKYMKEEFSKAIASFRDRFINAENPGFLLNPKYQKRDLPSDGLPHFASEIWKVIQSNRDLDLPGQRELLAMFRCEEIMETAFKTFLANIESSGLRANEIIPDFGKKAYEVYTQCIAEYRKHGIRYVADVSEKKQQTLRERALNELWHLFNNQITLASNDCLMKLDAVLNRINANTVPIEEVGQTLLKASEDCLSTWKTMAKACIMEETDWTFEREGTQLEQDVGKRVIEAKQAQLIRLMDICKSKFEAEFAPVVAKAMEDSREDMWNIIRNAYRDKLLEVNGFLVNILTQGFKCPQSELERQSNSLQAFTIELFFGRVKQKAEVCQFKMEKRFTDKFWMDPSGLPRIWKPKDNMRQTFFVAKDHGEQVLDLYAYMRMQKPEDTFTFFEKPEVPLTHNTLLDVPTKKLVGGTAPIDPSRVVIQTNDRRHIWDNYCAKTQSEFMKAQRDQEQSNSRVHIPLFVVGLIVILGFNEFKYVLFNPLLLMLCILLGGLTYLVWILNLGGVAETVFRTLTSITLTSIRDIVTTKLFPAPPPTPTTPTDAPKSDSTTQNTVRASLSTTANQATAATFAALSSALTAQNKQSS
ncbi:GTP-binding protein [Pelomyxa schiedti]|nr:GTP-binding protein [Pelomyxa schiedti]